MDGLALGGMSQQEAMDAISARAAESLSNWSVQLLFQGQPVLTLDAESLGMSIDMTDALNQAWAMGHTGSIDERRA